MKKTSGQFKTVVKNFNEFVEYNCGGDILGLFDYIINCKKYNKDNLLSNVISKHPKVSKMFLLLSKLSNENCYNKRVYLSLVRESGFTLIEAKQLGFNCSNESWATAGAHEPGKQVVENRGRKQLPAAIFRKIKKFIECDELTRPSSYQTIKKGDVFTPVRYLNETIKESFFKFIKKYPQFKISESAFRKILKTLKHIKKAKKQTDKCELCVCGKNIEKQISSLNATLTNPKVGGNYKKRLNSELSHKTALFDNYLQHKSDAAHQLAAMKLKITQLQDNEVLIIFDFKANIIIDQDPEYQFAQDYYQNVQRTCFGVVVYFKRDNEVKKHYYDFFSDYMIHDSYFVVNALERLFTCNFFKKNKKKLHNVHFWLDNGPHFRTKQLFHYFVSLKQNKKFKQVNWNFSMERVAVIGDFHRLMHFIKNTLIIKKMSL
jgi:hypothetical protein